MFHITMLTNKETMSRADNRYTCFFCIVFKPKIVIFVIIIINSYLSIYRSIALVDLGRFSVFLSFTHSVVPLGRGISPSQGRYLPT
jgi:hypothetical protein